MNTRFIKTVCFNCERPKPGSTIDVTKDGYCPECGRYLMDDTFFRSKMRRWDAYYHGACTAISAKSPCHSRKIGSLLVKDKVIVATGFNGPPRGYPHCHDHCPRRDKPDYESGKYLDECPAAHSEANCIASAARVGVSVAGTTLYLNCIIPCRDCMKLLVNAGVMEVVVEEVQPYHKESIIIAEYGNVNIRRFDL